MKRKLSLIVLLLFTQTTPAFDIATWARDTALPLAVADPKSQVDHDLERLLGLVGDSRIVSLGEATDHGTHEIYQMKHRIVRALVENREFTAFGIEANMSEAAAVNRYVLEGEGDPRDLPPSMCPHPELGYGCGERFGDRFRCRWAIAQ